MIASAISMAVGAYLAERSASEVALTNVEGERTEVKEHPEEEKQELSLFYKLKGLVKPRLARWPTNSPATLRLC